MNRAPGHAAGRVCVVIGMVLLAGVAGACAPAASGAETISVRLGDDAIELETDRLPSGRVDFDIANRSALLHELEIFAGAKPGDVLPVRRSVADTSGLSLVDEVEDILPGSRASLVADLPPGTYLLMCNVPGHYAAGMWTYVSVGEPPD